MLGVRAVGKRAGDVLHRDRAPPAHDVERDEAHATADRIQHGQRKAGQRIEHPPHRRIRRLPQSAVPRATGRGRERRRLALSRATSSRARLPAPAEGVHAWWSRIRMAATPTSRRRRICCPPPRSRARQRFGTPSCARAISPAAQRCGCCSAAGWASRPARRAARARRPRPAACSTSRTRRISTSRTPATPRSFAIAPSARIGVDLERRDRGVDAARLCAQVPHRARTRTRWMRCRTGARREYFLRLWTCKEAMSKATGDGLSAPLGRLSVSADGRRLALDDGPPPYVPADWRLARDRRAADARGDGRTVAAVRELQAERLTVTWRVPPPAVPGAWRRTTHRASHRPCARRPAARSRPCR